VGLLALLILLRFLPARGPTDEQTLLELENRASKAYSEKRYADVAEYVSHAVRLGPGPEVRPGLECLRGESLLRLGRAREAAASFQEAVGEAGSDVYAPQALSGLARAWRAAGEPEQAEAARERLLRDYPHTPWAELLATPAPQEAVAP
jgi:tetratricopeptide (TPR) repeat protein